jgi:hypothetical protein
LAVGEIQTLRFSLDNHQTSQQQPTSQGRRCCGELADYERVPGDSLSAGIKATLGKVYYFSASLAGMLLVKLIGKNLFLLPTTGTFTRK